jgi:hypothetical protein
MKFLKIELVPRHKTESSNPFHYFPIDAVSFMHETAKNVFMVTLKQGHVPPNFAEFKFVNDPVNILTI